MKSLFESLGLGFFVNFPQSASSHPRNAGSLFAIWVAASLIFLGAGDRLYAQTAQFSGVQTEVPTSNMNQPESVAVDGIGNIYIADSDNGRVLKESLIDGVYTESVIATGFVQVAGIAVDSNGKVYFADDHTNSVYIETPSGSGYMQSVIQTTGLTSAHGVAVDASGNIYVTDNAPAGLVVEEKLSAGTYSQSTILSGLNTPKGIAVDGSGDLYIADTGNNRILKETLSGGIYSQSVIASAGLGFPWGVAVDRYGNVYIVDAGNGDVLKETPSGNSYVQSIVPTSALNNALGIAVDSNGNVYIVQTEVAINYILRESPASSADFGAVQVGNNSSTASLFFTFGTGGKISLPSVVTQGISGLDFRDGGTGSCTTNGASYNYNPGDTCTVDVLFTPKSPGARYGAAVLRDNSGNVIATGYVQGTGIGPQVSFPPGTQSMLALSGFTSPYAVATDSAGNLYIANAVLAYHPNNAVIKETWNGSGYTASTIATGLGWPTGIAVDGAGNVYIADQDNYTVYKETLALDGTYTQSIVDNTLGTVGGIAVDASGNVYVGRGGIGVEKETLSGNTYNRSEILPFATNAIAVDGAGSLYLADLSNSRFVKETPLGAGYSETIIASPLDFLRFTMDSLGNIYYPNGGQIQKLTRTTSGYQQSTVTNGLNDLAGIAVDALGNLYYSTYSSQTRDGNVWKLDSADPPSLTFATTAVAATSTDSPQTVTVANIGNADLSFPVPGSGENPTLSAGFTLNDSVTSACPQVGAGASASATLAAGASCELSISFVPTAVSAITGSLVLTDNALNAMSPGYATQTIQLSGQGTVGTPTITWPTPAAITYGTALSSTQLNATASVDGTFSYSIAMGAILGPGSHTLTATFTPKDTTDYTVATASVTVTVGKATPTNSLTTSSSAVFASNPVTFTATVASSADAPTGTIIFFDGSTQLGTGALTAGIATYTTSTLAAGTHSIAAAYSGDANFETVTSAAVSETVEDFTIAVPSGSPSSATVSAGGQASYTLSVAPSGGTKTAAAITLAVSGLPSGVTSSFSPSTVAANSAATNVTLTVTASSTAMAQPAMRTNRIPVALGVFLLAALGCLRRGSRKLRSFSAVLLLGLAGLAGLATLTACGGGGSSSGGGSGGTTPQYYTITVTSTSGALSHTTTLTLTVK